MYYLARARCYSHGSKREHKPGGRGGGNASLLRLKTMSERWYSPRILSHTDLVQQICHLLNERVFKQNHVHIVFYRYAWHTSSGKSVGWTAVLILLLWFHTTKEPGQLQKATCAFTTVTTYFKQMSQAQRVQQLKLLQYLKIQPSLNYSTHVVIISIPWFTATNFALFYRASLWKRDPE